MLSRIKAKLQRLLQTLGVEVRRSPSGRRMLARVAVATRVSMGAEGKVDRIVFNQFFAAQTEGVFVEIGAARPDFLSIPALFRRQGWRIISVEPNPVFCDMHRSQGLEILQYACGEHDEDGVEFSVVHTNDGSIISNESFSSLAIKPGYRALKDDLDIEVIRVNLRRLDSIMEEYAPDVKTIDCLSVDTEGWELEVLKGFSLDKFKPRVMIIENLMDSQDYRDYMQKMHYRLWKTISPNEIYVIDV